MLRNFSVAISACLLFRCFNSDFYVSKICIYELGIFHANRTSKCLRNQGRTKGEGWATANSLKPPPPVISSLAGTSQGGISVLSPLSCSFFHFFFWLASLLLYLFVLYVILALWPLALQCQLPALLFVCVLLVFVVRRCLSGEPKQNQGRGLVDRKLVQGPSPPPIPPLPVILLLDVPTRLFCFGSLVISDVACHFLSLFLLYVNIKTDKKRC